MSPSRRPGLVARVVDDECVLLDRDRDRVHRLNATASAIWEVCDGGHSFDDIVAHLRARFPDAPAELPEHVATTVAQLRDLGLIDA